MCCMYYICLYILYLKVYFTFKFMCMVVFFYVYRLQMFMSNHIGAGNQARVLCKTEAISPAPLNTIF